MTGELASRISEVFVSRRSFPGWIDALLEQFTVIGPSQDGGQTVFREISSSSELFMEYVTTMLSPGKLFIYKPREPLFRFSLDRQSEITEIPLFNKKQIIVGIHPCDTNALLYLDRTFLGDFRDIYYEARRKNTILISLNCTSPAPDCFCRSVRAGPFLHAESGYDMLLTDFGDDYLVEAKTERARCLLDLVEVRDTGDGEMTLKAEKEEAVIRKISKALNTEGLNDILKNNPDHPVWKRTAVERCLSCSNCVMVCPTCFCFDVKDEISMDMKTVTRYRQFDACQDRGFAEVHGGNFRSRRTARLRQFVTHKLDHTHQYGVFGTVGCGRCITWCPTGIDMTVMLKEIRRSIK